MHGDEDKRGSDGATELVLDNRKLILGFGALALVCGIFFVLGFIEGRRQGIQSGMNMAAASNPASQALGNPAAEVSESRFDQSGKEEAQQPARDQLNWYRSVSKSPETSQEPSVPVGRNEEAASGRDTKESPRQSQSPSSEPATSREDTPTYTVQVGAFRQRKEAEAKAEELKSKGYQFILEAPTAPGELYLLKVGKFESRADAAVMQLRLKKDGFATFIKTN